MIKNRSPIIFSQYSYKENPLIGVDESKCNMVSLEVRKNWKKLHLKKEIRSEQISTNDSLKSEVQMIRHQSTDVSSERVSNAGRPIWGQSQPTKFHHRLGQTGRNRTDVVHGSHVARGLSQRTPVHQEHVVPTVLDVGWKVKLH